MLPMPPSTTIDSTITDSTSTKLSGLMNPCVAAKMPPEMPPNDAPIAKASSFMLRVLIPIARAAISSSRIASHARPIREFCSRRLMHDDDEQHDEQQVVVLDRPAERRARAIVSALREVEAADPERVDQVIPCGPLVRLNGCDRLLRKIRTISPKPSVTIAR